MSDIYRSHSEPGNYRPMQGYAWGVSGGHIEPGITGQAQANMSQYHQVYPFVKPSAPPMFFIGAEQSITCIYCLGDENALYSNILCKCAYHFHKNCFLNYVKKPDNVYNCPLCRSAFFVGDAQNYIRALARPANHQGQIEIQQEINREQIVARNRQYHRNRVCLTLLCGAILLVVVAGILAIAFTGSAEIWRQH